MSEELELEVATPEEPVVTTPEPVEQDIPTETDTVEETDEQKNERVQKESAARAEKRANSIQKRMDELTADKYAERKRADELAENNARLMAMIEENKTPQKQAETEPQRDQFNTDLDYFKSLAKFEAKQEALKLAWQDKQERQAETSRMSVENQKLEVAKEFRAREVKVEKELPDYKEVIEDWSPRLPNSTAEMILRLPDGPLIAYHLAKNPDLEKTLLEQPEYLHGVTLGQMLATIKSSSKTTAAPSASKTVGTTSSSSSDATEYRGDPEHYLAWAAKNLRKR